MPCCSASRPGDDATSHERAYLFLFFVSLLASWILRDFDVAVTSSVTPGLRGCVESKRASCDHEVVTRVSLGTAMFFLTLAALMWDSPDTSSWRHARVHRGSWAVKVPAWAGSIVAAFFLAPPWLAAAYFQAARVGGAAFLLVQIVVLLGTTYQTNERWLARATREVGDGEDVLNGDDGDDGDDDASRRASRASVQTRARACLLGGALSAYAFAIVCLAVAFSRFARDREDSSVCAFNATTLSLVTIVIAATTALSLRKDANAGLFTSGCAAAFAAYQALSALFSLPPEARCASSAGPRSDTPRSLEVVALVLALAALAASVSRAGSSHDAFGLPELIPRRKKKDDGKEDADARGGKVVAARAAAGARGTRGSAGAARENSPEGFGLHDVSLSDDENPSSFEKARKTHPAAATYFHLVFACAAMYAAMVLVGWRRAPAEVEPNALDRGWGSVWVKLGAAALGSGLYAWTILAPIAFPNREF